MYSKINIIMKVFFNTKKVDIHVMKFENITKLKLNSGYIYK